MREPIWFWWIMLVLATDAVLVLWFRGSLFATPRAIVEAWASSSSWLKWWVGGFLSCSLCLPPYAAALLFAVGYIPHGEMALYVLAATGMASRLFNSIWYSSPSVPAIGSVRHEQ